MDAVKDPHQRAHLWERPQREDEKPPVAPDPHFPMHVHKPGGEWKEVGDLKALNAALEEGWSRAPVTE